MIYVKLTKEWGGFKVGDVVRFGRCKGLDRIAAGEGIEVSKQQAVNDPIVEVAKPLVVEVATQPITKESAVRHIKPQRKSKKR